MDLEGGLMCFLVREPDSLLPVISVVSKLDRAFHFGLRFESELRSCVGSTVKFHHRLLRFLRLRISSKRIVDGFYNL
jgi:hypothetical protein